MNIFDKHIELITEGVNGTKVGIGNARSSKIKHFDEMTPEDQKKIMDLSASNSILVRTGDDSSHREQVKQNNLKIKAIESKYMSQEEKDKEKERKTKANNNAFKKRIANADVKAKEVSKNVALISANFKDSDIIKEVIIKLYKRQTNIASMFKSNIKWMKKGSPERIKAFKNHNIEIDRYENLIQELRTKFEIKESKTAMKSNFQSRERDILELHKMLPEGVEELFKKYKINPKSFY